MSIAISTPGGVRKEQWLLLLYDSYGLLPSCSCLSASFGISPQFYDMTWVGLLFLYTKWNVYSKDARLPHTVDNEKLDLIIFGRQAKHFVFEISLVFYFHFILFIFLPARLSVQLLAFFSLFCSSWCIKSVGTLCEPTH